MRKIAINGFGRIGRNVFRVIYEQNRELEIVAINDLADIATLAHLLKYDTVLGPATFSVKHDDTGLIIDGVHIPVLSERDPAQLPWKDLNVDVALECTGVFTQRIDVAKHLEAGARKVIISAPSPDPDLMIVLGANEDLYNADEHHVVSNASCTTNCLAPLVKALDEAFGIKRGLVTTIHAYTADQRLQDLPHSDLRRARAGAENIIPTSTGAARAIGIVMPHLKGKLDGVAIRVPVPVGSLTDLTVELNTFPGTAAINHALKEAALESGGIMAYTEDPLVSSDIIRDPHSCIVNGDLTQEAQGLYKIFAWYQNEWGYSSRMADLALFV